MASKDTVAKKMKTAVSVRNDMSAVLQPVLADEYMAPVRLVDMYICRVRNKKDTSQILKFLSSSYPLDKYNFLKRVRSLPGGELQIIVCDTAGLSDDGVLASLLPYSASLGPMFRAKVPASPPFTRQQFTDSLQYWPVNFHEDKIITRLLEGSYFCNSDLDRLESHMTDAIKMAEKAREASQLPVGAVIVDPDCNEVIARSHDLCRGNHPLQHAAMVCIDLVARAQGGGMWNYKQDTTLYSANQDVDTSNRERSLPYLCTGYHLYITREPCIMCAMALVHSRIECVFYGSSHSEGALGSQYKLHVQQGLNHHYRVFKGLLKEKCDQLYASS